jgi:uncharacterized protein YjbJ (UPF0337 family)
MSESEPTETTAGGAVGRFVGKAKSMLGSLTGNDDLQREGNLQQAQSEAEQRAASAQQAAELRNNEVAVEARRADAVAERDRLRTELEAEERKAGIERAESQRSREIAAQELRERAAIHERESLQERASDATANAALHRRTADEAEIARLEHEARNAEYTADVIDPEAK